MHSDPSFLQGLWFVLIGVLWAGFFVLEGFDFGVGVLSKGIARDDVETRMMFHAIGPFWDGNEVWLITAGGAMFAAFPEWYATVFSGFYLPLFLILGALIIRGVSFEFWGKVESRRWKQTWEWTLAIGSGLAALLFGVAWANFVHGVPMVLRPMIGGGNSNVVTSTIWGLLHPYAILGGLMTLSLFVAHGAQFLTLRFEGELQERVQRAANRLTPIAFVITLAFVIWTIDVAGGRISVIVLGVLTLLLVLVAAVTTLRNPLRAFSFSALAIVGLTAMFLCGLWPNVLPSTTSSAYNLTIAQAASHGYTLTVMTIVAAIFVPVVLGYTAWSYWVFKYRLGREAYEGQLDPVSVLGAKLSS